MGAPAIIVEGIGKKYRLGLRRRMDRTFREAVVDAIAAPFRRLRQLGGKGDGEDTFWALKDVSFQVQPGEVVGIIGRNGAGKSTLLKILSGITEPTAGRAVVFGRVGSLLEVGTGFHPELTGRENIYLNGAILGMRKAEIDRKFDEIVAFSEIERFLDTPVKRYSSGMYVRLAFAVAAHLEPEILFVDEVLAVGDAAFQKKCLGKMQDVSKGGRTVLFVSHNMGAVEQLCASVILLDRGRLVAFSRNVREVITRYLVGESGTGSSEWVNSGGEFSNPCGRPVRFCLTDAEGKLLRMPASNDSDMFVQVEFEVAGNDPALNVGYAIFSETGQLLYWTYHSDPDKDRAPRLQTGLNVLRARLPKRFLNEGNYRVELMASLHYREWICEPGRNSPGLILSIQGGLSDSPYFMARRPGLLAPILDWQRVEKPQTTCESSTQP